MMAVLGVLMAVIERAGSGKGQVVEVDMVGLGGSSLLPLFADPKPCR